MSMHRIILWGALVASLAAGVPLRAQGSLEALTRAGQLEVAGERHEYVLRYLPVSSFPQLPARVAAELNRRGCRIPQTWQAHGPENVIKASLEQAGSEDWAVLCAVEGDVSLLVFLASGGDPVQLAEATEISRLQPIGSGIRYGFGWGIDPATPEQVYQAQAGLQPRPERIDHDALADSSIVRKTVYRFFSHGNWAVLAVPE